MRYALGIEPASKKAKESGCICLGKYHISEECPVHYPLTYIKKIDTIFDHINLTKHYPPLTFIVSIIILIITILKEF